MKSIRFSITGIGRIGLKLEKGDIIIASLPEKIESKFKKKYPDGVIGNFSDYIDEKKLSRVVMQAIKSLD